MHEGARLALEQLVRVDLGVQQRLAHPPIDPRLEERGSAIPSTHAHR
jgi:hypothetical protein